MVISRRQIREIVMQILYAYEIRKESIEDVMKGIITVDVQNDLKSYDFALKIIHNILDNQSTIDSYIKKHADNWEINRMAIIDRNLIRIAVAEMLFLDDVPPKVSINEALEIAKKYSTDKSSRFVNGILDATFNELKNTGKLNKSGRGLIDMPPKKERTEHASSQASNTQKESPDQSKPGKSLVTEPNKTSTQKRGGKGMKS